MKKKIILVVCLLLVVMLFASCRTTISVKHLIPGEVDLSKFRTIAVASTDSYGFSSKQWLNSWVRGGSDNQYSLTSGFQSGLSDKVAELATSYLQGTLDDTHYFTVLNPKTTDAYIAIGLGGSDAISLLEEKGVKALLTSAISYMDCDETIYGKDVSKWVTEPAPTDAEPDKVISYSKVVERNYFLKQDATMTFNFSLMDLATKHILVTRSFTSKNSKETLIGTRVYNDGVVGNPSTYFDKMVYSFGYAPSFLPLFDSMLKSFQHEIQTILAPSYETISLTLMPNKPKNDLAKNGYKLAEAGSLRASYSLFLDIWNQDRHFPSGYNAALLLEALGDLSGAIDLMEAVCDFSQNSACYEQIGRMKEALAKQGQAEKQISGEESAGDQVVTKTQLITME
jgi:hypothetical protein